MPKNRPDERLVYLALRRSFVAHDAPSKPKKIRERLLQLSDSSEVRALIQEHNIDNVCQAAKKLVEEGVYQSTLTAKLRFPELFEVSPVQSIERAVSEAEAARCEVNVLNDVSQGRPEGGVVASSREAQPQVVAPVPGAEGSRQVDDATSPSLYPVYLPFTTQHKLLVRVQETLERACYGFAQSQMPETLRSEGWDCAELVELNIWTKTLKAHQSKFTTEEVANAGKSFHDLLDSISHLRHTAVHRLRVTAARVEQFMVDGESLCRLVRDEASSASIANYRRKMQMTLDDMKRNKDLLEARLAAVRADVLRRKRELERSEQAAVTEMLESDDKYQRAAGDELERELDGAPLTVTRDESPDRHQDVGDSEGGEVDLLPDEARCAEHHATEACSSLVANSSRQRVDM